ncbi:uncharacterized protein [Rhodnius prolixus]|uniref:uncharacterized protein n=1 Tax=Rhodnius prolixus TaxID=13249 RepID=UPI003D18DEA9
MCVNTDMFSALNLLRSYNQYIGPFQEGEMVRPNDLNGGESLVPPLMAPPLFLPPPPYPYSAPMLPLPQNELKTALRTVGSSRRPRSEKKPIPDEQKDERYYERRKRNNQAAKKSRDARRMREDQIALRASVLEHENAVLRAQVLTLREEAQSLRQLLLHQKKSPDTNLEMCSL